mmetsp:Transcript_71161/g.123450  ORF Transcript_71161/g.123450 Transcript_71161/m.123450 type:complete len:554 (-) Transcript_71161:180-1841(-)
MQTLVFLLLCSSCAHCGFGAGTATQVGDSDPRTMLASLLLTEGSPQAAVNVASLPKVNGQLKTSLTKEVKGVPVSVPVKFDGGKVTTGLDLTVKGVKVAVPLSFLVHELKKLKAASKPKLSELKKTKSEYSLPNGVKFSYPEGIVTYPLNFGDDRVEFTLPFSANVFKLSELKPADLKPDSVSAKLKSDLSFSISDQTVDVPLQIDGETVTTGVKTKVKGVKFSLPVSFLLSNLGQISVGKLAKVSHLKKLGAELDSPIEVDVSGKPVKIPLGFAAGKLTHPLKFDVNGWSLAVPLSSSVSQINGKLQSSLTKTVGGVPIEIPVKFDGEKLTSGLSFTVKGVKVAIPVSFLIRELKKLRPKKPYLSGLKKAKAGFSHPSGLEASYPEGTIMYPINFDYQGMEFTIPFSTSVSTLKSLKIADIKPDSVTGKFKTAFSFSVKDLPVEVPVKFEGEKVTAEFSTKVKGVKLTLPVSFLLSSLKKLKLSSWRDLAKLSHLKKVKAELDSPLKLDASGTPVTVPVSYAAGTVKYPLKFNMEGWSFEVPMSYTIEELAK